MFSQNRRIKHHLLKDDKVGCEEVCLRNEPML